MLLDKLRVLTSPLNELLTSPLDKLPEVKTCLCFCKLRTGAQMVGWICLIAHAAGIFGCITFIMEAYQVVEPEDINFFEENHISGEHMTRLASVTTAYCALGLIYVISIIASVILLLGVYKKRESMILLYFKIVVATYIITVVWAYVDLSMVWYLPVIPQFKLTEFLTRFLLYVTHIGIYFYFIVVIKSYYCEQLEAGKRTNDGDVGTN